MSDRSPFIYRVLSLWALLAGLSAGYFLIGPHHHTWTVVQHAIKAACTTTNSTCSVPVSSTGSGHIIAVWISIDAASETVTGISGGGTYVHNSNCIGTGATAYSDCWYTLSSSSGSTSIVATRSTSTSANWSVEIVE